MTDGLVRLFISNWHKAISENYGWETRDILKYARRIYSDIRSSRPLRDLSTYPLLCAMICGLWHSNDRVLPKTRNGIYEECCKMLMQNRDDSREIMHDVGVKVNIDQKLSMLEDIAYWMQCNSFASSKMRYVINRINLKIQNMSQEVRNIGAKEILEYLVERSGILRNPSGKEIDFIHKTFQEYLAARVIIRMSDYGLLVKNALDETWRETLLLAMGLADKEAADEIVSLLIKKAKSDNKYVYMSVACYNLPTELDYKLRDDVAKMIPDVIPPKSNDEAKLLGHAPETIVPFLKYNQNYNHNELKYCVEALIAHNTIISLNYLAEYYEKSHNSIRDYIFNASRRLNIQDVIDSDLSSAFFSYAFNKATETATISPYIVDLYTHSSHNVLLKKWKSVKLISISTLTILTEIAEINQCELVLSEDEYFKESDNFEFDDILDAETTINKSDYTNKENKTIVKKLILSGKSIRNELSLNFLMDYFNEINEIVLMNLYDRLIDLYAFSEIKGLKKIHFIGNSFYIGSEFSDIVTYFENKPIEVEITAAYVECDYSYALEMEMAMPSLSRLIINDNFGKHISDDDPFVFLEKYIWKNIYRKEWNHLNSIDIS